MLKTEVEMVPHHVFGPIGVEIITGLFDQPTSTQPLELLVRIFTIATYSRTYSSSLTGSPELRTIRSRRKQGGKKQNTNVRATGFTPSRYNFQASQSNPHARHTCKKRTTLTTPQQVCYGSTSGVCNLRPRHRQCQDNRGGSPTTIVTGSLTATRYILYKFRITATKGNPKKHNTR